MSTHAREQLIDRVIAEIKVIDNIDPGSVFDDPAKSLESKKLPALAVIPVAEPPPEVLSETQEEYGITRMESRELTIAVIAVCSSREMRGEVCNAVEYRVINDTELGSRRIFAGVDFESTSEGSRRLWIAQMRFGVTYHIRAHRPEEIIQVRRR